jgi:hypothetical protein
MWGHFFILLWRLVLAPRVFGFINVAVSRKSEADGPFDLGRETSTDPCGQICGLGEKRAMTCRLAFGDSISTGASAEPSAWSCAAEIPQNGNYRFSSPENAALSTAGG